MANVVAMGGGELPRDDGSGHTPADVGGRATVCVLSVGGGADPFGFAGHQIGADGEGVDHRSGGELRVL